MCFLLVIPAKAGMTSKIRPSLALPPADGRFRFRWNDYHVPTKRGLAAVALRQKDSGHGMPDHAHAPLD